MLKEIIKKTIEIEKNDILLFCTIRNEGIRLPFFIEYYKKIGVSKFFFIDNKSDDHPENILSQEINTFLFRSDTSFEYTQTVYLNKLIHLFGRNRWCLVVDCDEFFRFPFDSFLSIKELTQFLESKKKYSFKTLLLDMYSEKKLKKNSYLLHKNPWTICSYFDKSGYKLIDRCIYGGVRNRIFGLKRVSLTKYPLFKFTKPVHPVVWGVHEKPTVTECKTTGILFHFKFFSSFIFRAHEEAQREEHWRKSYEYKKYIKKDLANLSLYSPQYSEYFRNLKQLYFLGLFSIDFQYFFFVSKILFLRKMYLLIH